MKFMNAVKDTAIGLYRSLKRFPVTILFSTAVAIMLIVISELQPTRDTNLRDTLSRITMVFALGIPLSLCIKLFFERKDSEKIYKLVIYYTIGAVILLLYYFFLLEKFDMISTTRYIAVYLTLILGFLFIPYFPKKEQIEMYNIKIFTGFFITVIYSIVLYGGLSAILFAIDQLLAIQVLGKVYYYTFLFVALIFGPSYFLADIPIQNEYHTPGNYPKLLRILLLYIVMPLLSAYTTILYIYFVRIIVTRQWPVGLVSHLVLWYSVILSLVLFFITPIKEENKWANKFLIWAPRIILPILIMMFISMGIRINAYGVTESRYFVIALGLWVTGIMLYFSFTKKRRNIVLPVALAIVAILSVFGPLSSYNVSASSQNGRFEKILIRNNMLSDGKIQAAPSSISKEDKNEASRILDYFSINHSLKEVKYLPENFKMEDMDKVFGFPYSNSEYGAPEGYYYFTRSQTERVVDINGYDYLFDARNLYNVNGAADSIIGAVYQPEANIISINYKGNKIYEKDLKLFVKGLVDKYGSNAKGSDLSPEEMTFVEENEKIKIKFLFMSISGSKDMSTGNTQANGLDFYMLVKVK